MIESIIKQRCSQNEADCFDDYKYMESIGETFCPNFSMYRIRESEVEPVFAPMPVQFDQKSAQGCLVFDMQAQSAADARLGLLVRANLPAPTVPSALFS